MFYSICSNSIHKKHCNEILESEQTKHICITAPVYLVITTPTSFHYYIDMLLYLSQHLLIEMR